MKTLGVKQEMHLDQDILYRTLDNLIIYQAKRSKQKKSPNLQILLIQKFKVYICSIEVAITTYNIGRISLPCHYSHYALFLCFFFHSYTIYCIMQGESKSDVFSLCIRYQVCYLSTSQRCIK